MSYVKTDPLLRCSHTSRNTPLILTNSEDSSQHPRNVPILKGICTLMNDADLDNVVIIYYYSLPYSRGDMQTGREYHHSLMVLSLSQKNALFLAVWIIGSL